uniref:Uncharacterized protein n=1 Tax=Arundo donax TaxID=35708 RepID=A0A0A9FXZ8_ARUDO
MSGHGSYYPVDILIFLRNLLLLMLSSS